MISRKQVVESAVFVGILLAVFTGLELKARGMYRTKTDLFRKFELLDAYAGEIECLVLGSSHIAKGIDPNFLGVKSFNAAFSAQDIYYNHMIFDDYFSRMKRLKTVIIGLNYVGFGYDESAFVPYLVRDYHACRGYRPLNGYNADFILGLSELWLHKDTFFSDLLEGKKADNHVWPFFNGFRVPAGGLALNTLMASGLRFAPGTKSEAGFAAHAERVYKGHMESYNRASEPVMRGYLYRILARARENGIRVIIITPPHTRFYYEKFPSAFMNQFRQDVERIRHDFPGIEYYDFSRLQMPLQLFFNSNHLNFKGAEVFTTFLAKSVLNRAGSSRAAE